MCYYHQHACLLVCLSLLSACLTVKSSMNDSGHKENAEQPLNSRCQDAPMMPRLIF